MKTLVIALLLLISSVCHAQIKAVTSDGEEVVLYDNGTWKYVNKIDDKKEDIPLSKVEFFKSKEATFPVTSKTTNAVVNIDPKKWNFKKGDSNDASEFQFEMKGNDAYGLLITERLAIGIETLKEIAFQNAQNAAPDIAITKQEYRMVNGKKVLFLRMDGTIQGIKFTYLGYYFSSDKGTVQFLTYTGQNLLPDYEADLMKLLNGIEFVVE